MTDQPSEAALRKACDILGLTYDAMLGSLPIARLARHFDAEDRLAREAMDKGEVWSFARRHFLPANPVTVADVVERWRDTPGRTTEALASMLRDAGLLREDG